jgi:hypothetical protein
VHLLLPCQALLVLLLLPCRDLLLLLLLLLLPVLYVGLPLCAAAL